MNVTTIIVNGFARVGKDSFVAACRSHLEANGAIVREFSSIEPVRDLMRSAMIDVSAKTEADRKLLADVGAALEEHCNWRTNRCLDFIADQALAAQVAFVRNFERKMVVFLHIREPENIRKVIAGIEQRGIGVTHTVLLRGSREVRADNIADRAVLDTKYGAVLHNNGTLDDLHVLAGNYLAKKGLI